MDDVGGGLMIAALAIVLVSIVVFLFMLSASCERKGGVLVRGMVGAVCAAKP